MVQEDKSGNSRYEELELGEIFSVIWTDKLLIVGVTAIFILVSVCYALSIPNQYSATAVVTSTQGGGGGLASVMGRFGGLASLAGVDVGGGSQKDAKIARQIMQSRGFIEKFIKENDLSAEVFAARGWDKKANRLIMDSRLYDTDTAQWLPDAANGGSAEPSGWQLYNRFSDMFSVSDDPVNGVISISVEYYSPQLAKELVDKLIIGINDHLKNQKLQKVNVNIQYLEAQIQKTSITEMKNVFYTIIEEQIKSKMLAEASPEYAFITVSPAMIPEQKSRPNRSLICIMGGIMGSFLATLTVLIRRFAW